MEEKTYKLDELVPCIRDFVSRLKINKTGVTVPKKFKKEHPWTESYLVRTERVANLYRLAVSEGLVVEFVNGDAVRGSNPRELRIRVSLKEIRHTNGVWTEVFKFKEIFPNTFIYVPI